MSINLLVKIQVKLIIKLNSIEMGCQVYNYQTKNNLTDTRIMILEISRTYTETLKAYDKSQGI